MAIKNTNTGEVTHIGMVLHIRGTFRFDTSMDEVLIWNPQTRTASLELISGNTWANVDASPETKADYYVSIRELSARLDQENAAQKAKSVQVGSTVKVVRGRKVAKGTIAKVLQIKDFRTYVLLVLDNGQATYLSNVTLEHNGQFIEPELYNEKTFFFQAI